MRGREEEELEMVGPSQCLGQIQHQCYDELSVLLRVTDLITADVVTTAVKSSSCDRYCTLACSGMTTCYRYPGLLVLKVCQVNS